MAGRTTKPRLNPSFIDSTKAAKMIGCSTQNVNRLARIGCLSRKAGKKTYVDYGSVLDFIHHRTEPKIGLGRTKDELLRRIVELERRLALVELHLGKPAVVRDRTANKAESERVRTAVRRLHPEAFT